MVNTKTLALVHTTFTSATLLRLTVIVTLSAMVKVTTMLNETINLTSGDDSSLTIKDWTGLIRQGTDPKFLSGRIPTLVIIGALVLTATGLTAANLAL